MKHSNSHNQLFADILTFAVPLLLVVPNVMLGIMGQMSALHMLANLILPLGLLLLFMTIRGRVGLNTLLLIPLMVMAGFQIVLLFLYSDGSIIGVDMLLNVVTTNPGEAGELLGNLKTAIALVCILYVPPIIAGIVAICQKARLVNPLKRITRYAGLAISIVGVIIIATCKFTINEQLYPYNIFYNVALAVERTYDSENYRATSADFTYNAYSTRPDSIKEVYVAIIGETSRADNWQLFGYERPTNPMLSQYVGRGLVAYPNVLSESNTTHKSVPLMLSPLTADTYAEQLNHTRSVILAFKEAGYDTSFLTMQGRNGSYIDYFGEEADRVEFLREDAGAKYDYELLTALDSVIAHGPQKQLIVLHMYGSHFNYRDRYPREEAYFTPESASEANAGNRTELINAYDNTIRHTDKTLAGVIERLDSIHGLGGVIYASDHGEDIFDDVRKRFLHASPTPTFTQLHVPMLVYLNDDLRSAYPELLKGAEANETKAISSSESYVSTLTEMAGLKSDKVNPSLSVTSFELQPVKQRKFVSDRNEAKNLDAAGFRSQDFDQLSALEKRW